MSVYSKMSNNSPTWAPLILNKKTGKKQFLFVEGTYQITPSFKRLVKKEGIKFIDLPNNIVYDKVKKRILPIFMKNNPNKIRKELRNIIQTNPTRLTLPKNKLINLETNRMINKSSYITVRTGEVKRKFRNYTNRNGILYKTQARRADKLFKQPKKKNQNLVAFQIYNLEGDNEPTTLGQFIDEIKYAFNQDFSLADKSRPLRRVLLKFGREETGDDAIFRFFPLDDINNLYEMIDDYRNEVFGSDTSFMDEDMVSVDRLDMTYFRISLTGQTLGAGKDNFTAKSKYWSCDQPKTSNNLCLEGAIRRFLGRKERCSAMRELMASINPRVKVGELVPLTELKWYENLYKININVYSDSTHTRNNCILESESNFFKTMKLLFKDNHFLLIKKPILQIRSLNVEEKRELGIYKKPVQSYVEKLRRKEKEKLKEIIVIFDNETIFDRYDDNYLKVYGISWVVWDMDKPFNYDPDIHTKEPYCYYESGFGCIKKFIKFILNPPEGCIYKPVGFNNSRFDNFSLCEVAKKLGVLNNIMFVDGSILYASIEGCKNVWDASRFLVGMSLDSACKCYNTNPKKAPDLINHYEIQCYYEKNGMSGLEKLLRSNDAYILYNKLDCLCLLSLIQKMRNACFELYNEDIFDFLTISSMGYKIMDKMWSGEEEEMSKLPVDLSVKEKAKLMKDFKPKFDIYKAQDFQQDLFFRKSLTAGRTQTFFGRLDLKCDIAMGDIKSLYPTVMGCYGGNDCPMPYGKPLKTDKYVEGKLGIYRVNILHQRTKWKNKDRMDKAFQLLKEKTGINLYKEYAPNVIPHRKVDSPLDWDYKHGISDINLTSVDIEVLKWATEDPNCIEVFEGYYWLESRRDLFTQFLGSAKKEKTKQDRLKAEGSPEYNEALREMCKLFSNALSGKLLEAIHTDVNKIFSVKNWVKLEGDENVEEMEIYDFGGGLSMITAKKCAEAVYNDSKSNKRKPAYLGMFIYSYARRLMYKKILSRYLTLYMDTDSAAMPYFEWERLVYENQNGLLSPDCSMEVNSGEYGCIEEEVCSYENGVVKPATRIITISPKNYLVENIHNEKCSKRKMKGVRKNDYYLPLNYFGDYHRNEKNKLVGDAVEKVRSLTQEDIRRYREFGCCPNCIGDVLKKEDICDECKSYQHIMRKCYSTEMFESLVKEEKLAIFCSMINRIKYKIGKPNCWEFSEKVDNIPSIEEIEEIMLGNSVEKKGIVLKVKTEMSKQEYMDRFKKFKKENPQIKKNIKSAFAHYCRRFDSIQDEMEIKEIFKLKQRYLVKII